MNFTREKLHPLEPYFLEKLKGLLSIPSMYDESTITTNTPFGASIQESLDYMLTLGVQEGFKVKNVDGYAGHIEWGEGNDLIGILGHLDVVPAGEGWTTPPFEPTLQDGKLFARGAQDDKGPVMAAFLAMKWLKDLGVHPKKRVRLILGTDEERNWGCMKHYFEKEEMPVLGFSPDAQFPVIHAEKGLIDLEIRKTIKVEQSEFKVKVMELSGGERLNMVPYQAEVTLEVENSVDIEGPFQQFLRNSVFEGNLSQEGKSIRITVTGKSAHAMEPDNGNNALKGLLSFLLELPIASTVRSMCTWVLDTFEGSRGEGLQIDCTDKVSGALTLNLGTGSFQNGLLTLGLNIRYPVTKRFEEWYDIFQKKIDIYGANIHVIEHLESIHLEKEHPFVQQLLSIYNKHSNEQAVPLAIGGATYARALEQGVAFGAMFDDSPDTAHNVDEHIRMDDLLKATLIYAETIYELITE